MLRALFVNKKLGFTTEKYNPQIFRDFLSKEIEPEFTSVMNSFDQIGSVTENSLTGFLESIGDFIFPEAPLEQDVEKFITMIQGMSTSGVFKHKPSRLSFDN